MVRATLFSAAAARRSFEVLDLPSVEDLTAPQDTDNTPDTQTLEAACARSYESGYEAGHGAGIQEAEDKFQDVLARVQRDEEILVSLIGQLRSSATASLAARSEDVLALALEIVEAIIGARPSAQAERLASELPPLLGSLDVTQPVEVRVHPLTKDWLAGVIERSPGSASRDVQVLPDEQCMAGQAIVTWGATRVDLSTDAALTRLRATFDDLLRQQ